MYPLNEVYLSQSLFLNEYQCLIKYVCLMCLLSQNGNISAGGSRHAVSAAATQLVHLQKVPIAAVFLEILFPKTQGHNAYLNR